MINSSLGEKDIETVRRPNAIGTNHFLAISERALRNAICKNPAMALAVSAAIGVVVACLIKRR